MSNQKTSHIPVLVCMAVKICFCLSVYVVCGVFAASLKWLLEELQAEVAEVKLHDVEYWLMTFINMEMGSNLPCKRVSNMTDTGHRLLSACVSGVVCCLRIVLLWFLKLLWRPDSGLLHYGNRWAVGAEAWLVWLTGRHVVWVCEEHLIIHTSQLQCPQNSKVMSKNKNHPHC